MCFSLVFACLSVCLSVGRSVWGLDIRSLALLPTPLTPPCHTLGVQSPTWWEPGRAWASASTLAPEACVCVCARACMYMGNLCASMYKG